MIDASLVIGGRFLDKGANPMEDVEGTSEFTLQRQQMTCVLKFLDYSQEYTKFQSDKLAEIQNNRFPEEEAQEYREIYERWRLEKDKSGKNKKKADADLEQLQNIEEHYGYEAIAELRQKSFNRLNRDLWEQNEREKLEKDIAEFKQEKAQGFIDKVISAKTSDEKRAEQKEIERFVEKKHCEFERRLKDENEGLVSTEAIIDFSTPPRGMPLDWVQFKAFLAVPYFSLDLLDEESTPDEIIKLLELDTTGIKIWASYGHGYQSLQVKLGTLDIADKVLDSEYFPYLSKTIFPKGYEDMYAILFKVERNITRDTGPIEVTLRTNAYQYFVVNIELIK